MRIDLARLMAVFYPIIVIGLIVLFLVSFYLFINRIMTSRRDTVRSLHAIEHKLDLILNQMDTKNSRNEAE